MSELGGLLWLDANELERALPMKQTISVMRQAFADLSSGRVDQPPRLHVKGKDDGLLLVKPAAHADWGMATKLVSVFPHNSKRGKPLIHGLVALFDSATGEPVALLEGAFLTAWRTGAASGAATELLARPDAEIGAVIGCGAQGETQVLAIDAARDLKEIRVAGRDPSSGARLVSRLGSRTRARVVAAASPRVAVRDAEVVCTATTSSTAVVDDAWLAPGCHVNAIGTFSPTARELEGATVGRARIFVDCTESARAEAGDLLLAEKEGRTTREYWIELGEIAAGRDPGRRTADELTLFKSVGVAIQDLAAAALADANARREGLGRKLTG